MSLPFSWASPSNSSAMSLALAASISSARDTDRGRPPRSSSPVRTMVISASFRVPAACIARRAATMMTSPPFISLTPGPSARSPRRTYFWNGLSGSKTVSRWPMSSIRLPLPDPLWTATRWPARSTSCIGTQRTSKSSAFNSACIRRPTSSTPGLLSVPLLMLTSVSNSWRDRASSAAAARTSCCSCADRPAASAGPPAKTTSAAKTAAEFLMQVIANPQATESSDDHPCPWQQTQPCR